MKRLLEVRSYAGHNVRIVRYKNDVVNLKATLARMYSGQSITVRMTAKTDVSRVVSAANNAKVRIKIGQHPALYTILVTSLGPQRKRKQSITDPTPHERCFHGWQSQKASSPGEFPLSGVDIFS